jgi:hypothetical protein
MDKSGTQALNGSRRWEFVADMTGNGTVTVSDFWQWIEWLYFWPGDGLMYLVMKYVPAVGAFLELTPGRYGGPLSLFISFGLWIVALVLFVLAWQVIDKTGARAAAALLRPFRKREEIDPEYRRSSRK